MQAFDREPSRARAAALLAPALAAAGEIALTFFGRRPRMWRKADGTPVTEADIAVDDLLRERLAGALPEFGWVSEESRTASPSRADQPVWLVDPIDGTQSFISGAEDWCIAVALLERGRPVVGGVLAPGTGDYFEAVLGSGAKLNGAPIEASRRRELEGAHLMVKPRLLARSDWAQPWPPVRTGVTASIALRLCQVASGRYDATFALGHKADWDLAAGDLIVGEAGGRVTDLDGAPLLYGETGTRRNGFVASGAHLHPAIVARTTRQGTAVAGGR